LPLKILASVFLAATLILSHRNVRAEEFAFRFESSPPSERLRPQGESATLALTVTALDGRPVAEGWVAVRLDAPPPNWLFSTDFPVVEGSRLLEMRLPLLNGKAEWRQVFPIRGEYRLAAEFAGSAGAKTDKVFSFHVHEKDQKWLGLGGFTLGLFITGVIAGRIFSAPRDGAGMKLGLWFYLILTWSAAAGVSAWAQEDHKRNYISKIDVAPATVGSPARIHWWLHPAGVNGESSAKLTVSITHLEKKKLVFSLEKIPVAGEFALDYHFTDGTDHRVITVAETEDGATVRQEATVSVTAVAPSLRTKLPPLFLFLAVIAVGLLVGWWSQRAGGSKLRSAEDRRSQA
jgi:hypothetical protein